MGTFQKYSACAQWVLGGQIASELTMNSPCTHWVNAPSPPVSGTLGGRVRDGDGDLILGIDSSLDNSVEELE